MDKAMAFSAPTMASIQLTNIGKRFRYEWIFKKIDYQFELGTAYALLGGNGSGKSTLLQILTGSLTPSAGNIQYKLNQQIIEPENLFEHISWTAPAIEIIEEFTLVELIDFQANFKSFLHQLTTQQIIDLLSLPANKEIRYFSSGMKQRVKLALALLADTPFVFLDEPTTNLDEKGIEWYHQLIEEYTKKRLVIVASNQPHEYEFCQKNLNVLEYK